MPTIEETLVYFRQFRATLTEDIEVIESGVRETFDLQDGGRVNTTAQTLADLKRRLAQTDKLIAAYEERR